MASEIIKAELFTFGVAKPTPVSIKRRVFELPVWAGVIIHDGVEKEVVPFEDRVFFLSLEYGKKPNGGKFVFEGWVRKSEIPLFRKSLGMDNDEPTDIFGTEEEFFRDDCFLARKRKDDGDIIFEDILAY